MARSRANMRLREGCERYATRSVSEGKSETTLSTAHHALERFKKAVGTSRNPDPYLHTITAAMMDDYCYGPKGIRRSISAASFNRYLSVLRGFFEYAVLMQWCDTNPTEAIASSRPDAVKPRLMLNATELLALLDYAANPIERIGCAIAMNTGLRANDVRHLTVFDASLASGMIQTEIRKSRKIDLKPITTDLQPELERWLNEYARVMGLPDRGALPDDWLIVPSYRPPAPRERRHHVHPYPTRMLRHPYRLVQRPLGRMGYPTKGEGFHTLRRSVARALFESLREGGEGRDHALMIVQDFLNHSDTKMTQHYLGLNQERAIRDALLKGRPFLSKIAETEQARVLPETVARLTHLPIAGVN